MQPQRRFANDFQAWAAGCVTVSDKLTGTPVPFILNAPQRRVLAEMERQRRARKPIRIILLKARQWGGSTLVQMYMAWLQLVHRRGWNSVICSHVKDASSHIRGMYSLLLRHYPEDMKLAGLPPDASEKGREAMLKTWAFTPYERSQNIAQIVARECTVTMASALSPDSLRGGAYSMAHLSEVAFWGEGDAELAARTVRSIQGSIPRVPDSLVVMESTADGPDGFFHSEWERAERGESDKIPLFVPWHEIEIYRREVSRSERPTLLANLDAYEQDLLGQGVGLEAVAWYHDKRREYSTHEAMMAEYPSTPAEAFQAARSEKLRVQDFL